MKELSGHFAGITNRLKTSSAVVPAILFLSLCALLGFSGLRYAPPQYATLFVLVIAVGVFVPAFQIIFFTFVDRDRLHNEEHLERKIMLAHMKPEIGDSSSVKQIPAEMTSNLTINHAASAGGDV
ncbi:hypothetical protein [Sphingomonas elodea]|uniref:hypothetical protein n=1 Tax=Sphingomonas elodea TaxID=179878 RepID=UPI00111040A4|nr:hypothetical protein [Sphingomonas elodea]